MKKSALALAVAALISIPVSAAEGQTYFYGDYGSSQFQNISPLLNPGMFDFGVGYQFRPNIAGELGYTIFGDSKVDYGGGNTATLKTTSLHAAVVGIAPINDTFELFAKLGFSANKGSTNVTGSVTTTKPNLSKTDAFWGLGARYYFNKQISMHVQYQNFGKFDSGSQPISANTTSIGASYYF